MYVVYACVHMVRTCVPLLGARASLHRRAQTLRREDPSVPKWTEDLIPPLHSCLYFTVCLCLCICVCVCLCVSLTE